jgi:hypothetical protein
MNNMNDKLLNEIIDQEMYEILLDRQQAVYMSIIIEKDEEDTAEHVRGEILEDQLKELEEYENQ